MIRRNLIRTLTVALAFTALAVAAGCDGDAAISTLDVLNTIFLGITAAGAIALFRAV